MTNPLPQLQKGIAIVVLARADDDAGLNLAKAIARSAGRFACTRAEELDRPFQLGRLLELKPHCLIVEGLPKEHSTELVKRILTNDEIVCEFLYQWPRSLPTPHLIFVSSDTGVAASMADRQFKVIRVAERGIALSIP